MHALQRVCERQVSSWCVTANKLFAFTDPRTQFTGITVGRDSVHGQNEPCRPCDVACMSDAIRWSLALA